MSAEVEFYSQETRDYHKRHESSFGRVVDLYQQRIVQDFVRGRGFVLDLACGTGRFLNGFHEESMGVDGSSMISLAKGNRAKGDVCKLPLRDNSVDCVVCVNAYNHFSNYKEALREVTRILKPKGKVLLNFSNLLSPALFWGLLVNLRKKAVFKDVYTRWDCLGEVKRDFSKAGLKVTNVQGVSWFGCFCYSVFVEAVKC